MKNLAILLSLTLFYSCERFDDKSYTEPIIEPMLYAQNEANIILGSVYIDYYNHFLANRLGYIDNNGESFDIGNDNIYVFHSKDSHLNNADVPKASLITGRSSNGNIIVAVHDYTNVVFMNDLVAGGYVSIKLINGVEIYRLKPNSEGRWVLEDGDDLGLVPTSGINDWWNCTTGCYKTAKDICGNDPDCDFLCDLADLVGQCTLTIAAACSIHCINNNGVFNPPIPITMLNNLNPYGF